MKNRKGEVLVEAAIIMPLIILIIVSLMTLMIFFYSCLQNQVKVHEALLEEAVKGTSAPGVLKKNETTSYKMKGITGMLMKKDKESRIYVFRESEVIRAGDFIP